jgi:hypothetical protein
MAARKITRGKNTKRHDPAAIKSKPKRSALSTLIRQMLLTLLSIGLVWIMYSLPSNKNWILKRIVPYFNSVDDQMKQMDIEKRRQERLGYSYQMSKWLCEKIGSEGVLLVPPHEYLVEKANGTNLTNVVYHGWALNPRYYGYCPHARFVNYSETNPDSVIALATHTVFIDEKKQPQLVSLNNEQSRSTIKQHFTGFTDQIFITDATARDYLIQRTKQ